MTETEMLSEEQLKEIEVRAHAATVGPWETDEQECFVFLPERNQEGQRYAVAAMTDELIPAAGHFSRFEAPDERNGEPHANMRFIAHAREDIPALCQTVRALREKLKGAKVKMGKWEFTEDELEQQYLDATRLGAATTMHSRCVEKVKEMRDEWESKRNGLEPLSKMRNRYDAGFCAANEIITALESLPLEQGEQEKKTMLIQFLFFVLVGLGFVTVVVYLREILLEVRAIRKGE